MRRQIGIVDLYYALSSPDESQRITTALEIVKAVSSFQASFTGDTEASRPAKSHQEAHEILHHDVVYALERLLKGLTSTNDCARQGYSLALTHLLRQPYCKDLDVDFIVDWLDKVTNPKTLKGDDREHHFGRIFGVIALIKSGTLSRGPLTTYERVIKSCLETGRSKKFMRQVTAKVLGALVEQRSGVDDFIFETALSKDISDSLDLYLLLSTKRWREFRPNGWDNEQPILSKENVPRLLEILKSTTDITPQVDLIWELVIKRLLASPKKAEFDVFCFYKEVICDGLLRSDDTPEIVLGLQTTQMLCDELPKAKVPALVSDALLGLTKSSKGAIVKSARTLLAELVEKGGEASKQAMQAVRVSKKDPIQAGDASQPTRKSESKEADAAEAPGGRDDTIKKLDQIRAEIRANLESNDLKELNYEERQLQAIKNRHSRQELVASMIKVANATGKPQVVMHLFRNLVDIVSDEQALTLPADELDNYKKKLQTVAMGIMTTASATDGLDHSTIQMSKILSRGQSKHVKFPGRVDDTVRAVCWLQFVIQFVSFLDGDGKQWNDSGEDLKKCKKIFSNGSAEEKAQAFSVWVEVALSLLASEHAIVSAGIGRGMKLVEKQLPVDALQSLFNAAMGDGVSLSGEMSDSDDTTDSERESDIEGDEDEETRFIPTDPDGGPARMSTEVSDSDSDHEATQPNEALLKALMKAKVTEESDSDIESLLSATDEQMMKMDGLLAAEFNKQRKAATGDDLLEYRLAVLNVVEGFIKRSKSDPGQNLLQALPSLLPALDSCVGVPEGEALQKKASTIATDLVSKFMPPRKKISGDLRKRLNSMAMDAKEQTLTEKMNEDHFRIRLGFLSCVIRTLEYDADQLAQLIDPSTFSKTFKNPSRGACRAAGKVRQNLAVSKSYPDNFCQKFEPDNNGAQLLCGLARKFPLLFCDALGSEICSQLVVAEKKSRKTQEGDEGDEDEISDENIRTSKSLMALDILNQAVKLDRNGCYSRLCSHILDGFVASSDKLGLIPLTQPLIKLWGSCLHIIAGGDKISGAVRPKLVKKEKKVKAALAKWIEKDPSLGKWLHYK